MKTIYLISCCKKKLNEASPAEKFYCSPNFKKELKIAQLSKPDAIFVISAKYHLVELDAVLNYYDVTLKNFSPEDNKEWADVVIKSLEEKFNLKEDKFVVFASEPYFKNLKPHLLNAEFPIAGLKTGEIGKKLKNMLKELEETNNDKR